MNKYIDKKANSMYNYGNIPSVEVKNMDVKIDSLIPFDSLRNDLEHVFSVVEKNGKAVLLKDNKPAYIVLKYDEKDIVADNVADKHANYTLQEAMKIVLLEVENKTMHLSWLMKYSNVGCICRKTGRKHNILRLGQGVGITRNYLRPSPVTISN
jgi:hypothetical protein